MLNMRGAELLDEQETWPCRAVINDTNCWQLTLEESGERNFCSSIYQVSKGSHFASPKPSGRQLSLVGTKVRDDCTGLKVATACSSAETR